MADVLDEEQKEEALALLEEEHGEAIHRNDIRLPGYNRLISVFAKEISERFKDSNIFFFRPESREIIEIGKIKHEDEDKFFNGFITLDPNRFITIVEKYFNPGIEVKDKDTGEKKFIKKSISKNVATITLVSDEFRDKMPEIDRIFTIPIPILYKNELTFPKKGYDDRFKSWLPYNSPEIIKPDMALNEAKAILKSIYNEFCFQSKQDYINAIAALLTPFLRGLFPAFNTRTPCFFYLANRERAGKDYLAGITGILYEGQNIQEPAISTSENSRSNNTEELRKKIFAALISGRKRLHFSNNKGYIDNSTIEAILTSEHYEDRILGRSEILCFSNEIDFSMSGNLGVTLSPDLTNRSIFIKLFLEIENANEREFKTPNLHYLIKKNRGLILSALYALVRNWIEQKCPKGKECFASFPDWAVTCGGILECAGYDNPCKTNYELTISANPELTDMKNLFEVCYAKFPDKAIDKSQIKVLIETEGLFQEVSWFNSNESLKFWKNFHKYVGRTLSEIRLIYDNDKKRCDKRSFIFTKEKREINQNDIFL